MKLKRIISVFIVLAFAAGIFGTMGASANVAKTYDFEDGYFATRDDFYWGFNIHDKEYSSYPAEYLEQHIYLVANAGCNIIRINIRLSDDWTYYDKCVELCNAYGLTTIAVFSPSLDLGLDYITMAFETVCTRYNGENGRGKIDYIQAWNETDNVLMKAKLGNSGASGMQLDHYYTISVEGAADLPEYLEYFRAAQKGIDNSGSDVKFMTNFAYKHFAPYRYYLENGVEFDAIGWDWYAHYGTYEEEIEETEDICTNVYEGLVKDYPLEVIICESNTSVENFDDWENVRFDEYFPAIAIMKTMYNKDWVNGLCVYELLDEMQYASGSNPRESKFGFVNNDITGKVGEPKEIYYEYQRLIGGMGNVKLIPESTIDLSPYAALKVDTADDSAINKDKDEQNTTVESTVDNSESSDMPESDNSAINKDEDKQNTIVESTVDNTISSEETDAESSPQVQEVKTPVKQINTTQTVYDIPWLFIIIGSAVLLLLSCSAVSGYLYWQKRKQNKQQ